jgi:hypothetical protein
MNSFTKLAFLLCPALTVSAVLHPAFAATIEVAISARLDALEKENATLKQRLKRIENSAATSRHALPPPAQPAGLGTLDSAALDAHAQANRTRQVYKSPVTRSSDPPHHFEVSGSLLYLQPDAGDLEYATLVSPLPLPTPHWTIRRSARTSPSPSTSA